MALSEVTCGCLPDTKHPQLEHPHLGPVQLFLLAQLGVLLPLPLF